jgi:hypothetical protein
VGLHQQVRIVHHAPLHEGPGEQAQRQRRQDQVQPLLLPQQAGHLDGVVQVLREQQVGARVVLGEEREGRDLDEDHEHHRHQGPGPHQPGRQGAAHPGRQRQQDRRQQQQQRHQDQVHAQAVQQCQQALVQREVVQAGPLPGQQRQAAQSGQREQGQRRLQQQQHQAVPALDRAAGRTPRRRAGGCGTRAGTRIGGHQVLRRRHSKR